MAQRRLAGPLAALRALARDPLRALRWGVRTLGDLRDGGFDAVRQRLSSGTGAYQQWVARFATLDGDDRAAIRRHIERFETRPTISILMPVYNVDEQWLRMAIESALAQLYPHWELCIADDASPREHVRRVLEEYAARDERIRVAYRTTNGHISAASNSALELATGELVALLDHDDALAEHALYMVAAELQEHPRAVLIYSDEDGVTTTGERFGPIFKPDFSPELLLSVNCISHLGVYRTEVVREAGGFRIGLEGSQDLDLALRVIERTEPTRIRHIPHVLYHWRAIPGSVQTGGGAKEYAHDAARRAIGEYLGRRGEPAVVSQGYRRLHRVEFALPDDPPSVTVIVSAGADREPLARTLETLVEATAYDRVEVVIVTGEGIDASGSGRASTKSPPVRAVVSSRASALDASVGDIVVFVTAGLVARDAGWMRELVSHALREGVGAVGGRIVDARSRIVHAGLALDASGRPIELYRGARREDPGQLYRAQILTNYSACSIAMLAVRRERLVEAGMRGLSGHGDVSIGAALCLRLRQRGYRIVWTPYAELVDPAQRQRMRRSAGPPRERSEGGTVDPYMSPNLAFGTSGVGLAFPPRVVAPWRAGSKRDD